MSTHTTTPPHADQTGQAAAEPPPQVSRFDQRGIALQTVIIMVVLLAIAGGIAAVLLNRGQTASGQLEDAALGAPARSYTSEEFCRSAGFTWTAGATPEEHRCQYPTHKACENAGGLGYKTKNDLSVKQDASGSFCHSSGGTFLGLIA